MKLYRPRMKEIENSVKFPLKDSTDYSKCALCHEIPNDARLLDCFHSFCLQCLDQSVFIRNSSNFISCSLCGRDTSVGTNGVRGLKKNQFLSSAVPGEDIIQLQQTCDHCDGNHAAEAMCLECKENLCDVCHLSHTISKASKDHNVMLFDGKLECKHNIRKPDELNPDTNLKYPDNKCLSHKGEELSHYCRVCAKAMCKVCRQHPGHKGHRTKPLNVAMGEKRKQLSQKASSIYEGYLEILQRKLNNAKKQAEFITSNSGDVIQEVIIRAESFKHEIEVTCDRIIEEIREKEKIALDKCRKLSSDLESEILAVGSFLKYLQSMVDEGSDLEMAVSLESLKSSLEEYENRKQTPRIEKMEISFEMGEMSSENLRSGFGNITTKVRGVTWSRSLSLGFGDAQDVNLRMSSSFDCPLSPSIPDENNVDDPVHAIGTTSSGDAWTCLGWESSTVNLVDKTGALKRTIDLGSKIDDIVNLSDGGIAISCFGQKSIKISSSDMSEMKVLKTPFYPRGLAACSDGGLLVCMTDNYSTFIQNNSRRLVMKFSQSGEHEATFEFNGQTRLFTRPYRIAENKNGDMCISDRTSMGSGRVVVLDSNGNLKFAYEGPKKNQCKMTFDPAGIVCDRYGRILVADTNNNCVHMLDKSGQFVGFVLKEEDLKCCPHSLTFDDFGCLWIGDESGSIKVFDYLN